MGEFVTWIKAYADEHKAYPREQRIRLTPRLAELTTLALAKAFGLHVYVHMTARTVGKCWGATIQLPASGCSLGLVLHELAHAYNRQKYGNGGHTGTFKNALSLLYHHSRPLFEKILKDSWVQLQKERFEAKEAAYKQFYRLQKEAEKRAAAVAERKTPAYKVEKLRARIKRLESRSRRLATILKSAKRSLGIYERLASKKREVKSCVDANNL